MFAFNTCQSGIVCVLKAFSCLFLMFLQLCKTFLTALRDASEGFLTTTTGVSELFWVRQRVPDG
jgi:hypothetical protein